MMVIAAMATGFIPGVGPGDEAQAAAAREILGEADPDRAALSAVA
jgi:hypothetical protein